MKTTYDFLVFCSNEYFDQIGKIYILTPETMTACNMCVLAYDYIVGGIY